MDIIDEQILAILKQNCKLSNKEIGETMVQCNQTRSESRSFMRQRGNGDEANNDGVAVRNL